MMFVIKGEIGDGAAETLSFPMYKTMYGGKSIVVGDTVFVFASDKGLVARAVVTAAKAIPRRAGITRQTPRVSITVRPVALAKRTLGRSELKHFAAWDDGRPETELNFKFYRQATNKIGGISPSAAAFLSDFF